MSPFPFPRGLTPRAVALVLGGAAAAAIAIGARVPLLGLPLTTDEGGYGVVARLWARGETLYEDTWVDRPQGLLLVFRALLHVGGGSTEVLRLTAAIAAALLALVVMAVASRIAGTRAGIAAGLLAAAAGSSPFLESYTLSGELLAAIPAAAAILAFTLFADRGQARWLLLAGSSAGVALMLKQSAIDPVLAIAALLVWRERRAALRPLALFGGAVLAPIALAVVAANSASAWWYAIVGYRRDGDSLLTGSFDYRLQLLGFSLPAIVYGLAPVLVLGCLGWRSSPPIVRLWVLSTVPGVLGGGNFHAHYYAQLIPPLAVAGGIFLSRLLARPRPRPSVPLTLAAAAIAFGLAANVPVYFADREDQVNAIFHRDRLLVHEWSARYIASHGTPGDRILVIPEGPNVHYLTDQAAPIPYLWAANVREIPGALDLARGSIAARRPRFVVTTRNPDVLDASGRLGDVLRANYRVVARRGSARVLARA